MVCTTFRSDFHVIWKNQNKHSMLNLSFDALAKWREPYNKQCFLIKSKILFEEITIRKNEVDELWTEHRNSRLPSWWGCLGSKQAAGYPKAQFFFQNYLLHYINFKSTYLINGLSTVPSRCSSLKLLRHTWPERILRSKSSK